MNEKCEHIPDNKVYMTNSSNDYPSEVERLYAAMVNKTYIYKCKKCGEFYK